MTFFPSSEPKGNRLNVASNAFTTQMKPIILPRKPVSENTLVYNRNVTRAITMFADEPAAAILPISNGLVSPRNMTAPGAANTTPVVIARIKEKRSPIGNMRNSDHSPYFCAMNLWESSWTKNAVNNARNAIGRERMSSPESIEPKSSLLCEKGNANATVRTIMAITR